MANVFEEGLLGQGCTLAARLLDDPGAFLLNFEPSAGGIGLSGRYLSGTGQWIESVRHVPFTSPHFPYGAPVEPP